MAPIGSLSPPLPSPAHPTAGPGRRGASGTGELTTEEQQAVKALKRRDQEVRTHEQAHKAVGGSLTAGPFYEYTKGPDGQRYATGGEVTIDTAPEREPDATIRKMDIVKRAALAPAEPSPQDRAVAARAEALRAQAQADLLEQQQAARDGQDGGRPAVTAEAASQAYRRAATITEPPGGPPQPIRFARSI